MAGSTHALDAGGDAGRRLDLQHEVDGAHVDAKLECRGRDQAAQRPRLQLVLDQQALLAGDRAVVRAHQVFVGQLVDACGDALREPA